MSKQEIIAEIQKTIGALYAIRLPAQELTASTAIMRETIHLNEICQKLKEEKPDETDDQPE